MTSVRPISYKLEAIGHAGSALRSLVTREFVEARATFVPIPCSKAVADPDYDDRLSRVLARAFHGWDADVREMLALTKSTPADHESVDRLTIDRGAQPSYVLSRNSGISPEPHRTQ
jgi:hypothetical protein